MDMATQLPSAYRLATSTTASCSKRSLTLSLRFAADGAVLVDALENCMRTKRMITLNADGL